MRVSATAYGWTDEQGRVCVSLFPVTKANRPFNTYANRDEAQAAIYARRNRVTKELAYPQIVWEN